MFYLAVWIFRIPYYSAGRFADSHNKFAFTELLTIKSKLL